MLSPYMLLVCFRFDSDVIHETRILFLGKNCFFFPYFFDQQFFIWDLNLMRFPPSKVISFVATIVQSVFSQHCPVDFQGLASLTSLEDTIKQQILCASCSYKYFFSAVVSELLVWYNIDMSL